MTHPALVGARREPYWLDTDLRPPARSHLRGTERCDLAIIGGGFTGLWTAVLAKEADPDRDIVLIDAERVAGAATGRNGGFCDASLTHGEANGRARWPDEFETLQRLGLENLDAIEDTIRRYGIDCGFERTGEIDIATQPHQIDELREEVPGSDAIFLDAAGLRAKVESPTYLAGSWRPDSVAILDPAALAWGLARVAEALGVRIYEDTPALRLRSRGHGVDVRTPEGVVVTRRVAMATNAHRPLLQRLRWHIAPVYDYALMTEPLSDQQLATIGWEGREGLADVGNFFHYYRLTTDNRILWGGYDAIYHFGRRISPAYDHRAATYDVLAEHFFETYPTLTGLRFSHAWGGAIDASTRFCAFFGLARRGRVAYALGYTGLGVGASRFGAAVMLDLLDGRETERTALRMVRRRPGPFPPEPIAALGIWMTQWSLGRADRNGGRRNLWLRLLDALGLGFES
ncbi:oxidoreductase [Nocardioides baekrokdamisoli]|uniref:Oxidoreductase n=1 Tax=Nocardioides baekrokdamisoli TaxID=1804624 RepID=A0A3G9J183_9ACTN|nr:FAD-binding oxidoreductase [Nocardioides baekrokdamisoli]BBH17224.1 oxidoreductase [Nocardioides baekrokdamisoli]